MTPPFFFVAPAVGRLGGGLAVARVEALAQPLARRGRRWRWRRGRWKRRWRWAQDARAAIRTVGAVGAIRLASGSEHTVRSAVAALAVSVVLVQVVGLYHVVGVWIRTDPVVVPGIVARIGADVSWRIGWRRGRRRAGRRAWRLIRNARRRLWRGNAHLNVVERAGERVQHPRQVTCEPVAALEARAVGGLAHARRVRRRRRRHCGLARRRYQRRRRRRRRRGRWVRRAVPHEDRQRGRWRGMRRRPGAARSDRLGGGRKGQAGAVAHLAPGNERPHKPHHEPDCQKQQEAAPPPVGAPKRSVPRLRILRRPQVRLVGNHGYDGNERGAGGQGLVPSATVAFQ